MRFPSMLLVAAPALIVLLAGARTDAIETDPFWRVICASSAGHYVTLAAVSDAGVPAVAACGPQPSVFNELPSVGSGGDVTVKLKVGYDPVAKRLCFVDRTLPAAPVIHVGAGHSMTITVENTLHNTGGDHGVNCPIQVFGGESYCAPTPIFGEKPGANAPYYPIEANQAHLADGTTNLHVHGLFVSPQPCSDDVLQSTVYPANWIKPVAPLLPCQTSPYELTYTYNLPPSHPSGLYWYHTHRHGAAEHQTQMGLVGAIVVEDSSDAKRRAIGVTDEVLVVTDTPIATCINGPSCDAVPAAAANRVAARQAARQMAKQALAQPRPVAASAGAVPPPAGTAPTLDPRIDEVDQAGGCATGAVDSNGGYELWTLLLNGVPVQDSYNNQYPPDGEIMNKTMQPGQRQLFRLVNASANSFIAPQLSLRQNGVETVLPLEVYARDGVGLADANGNRELGSFDVAATPLIVPPAGRIEFVVHAPPAGSTLHFQSTQVAPGCGGNLYPARRFLAIKSAGKAVNPGAADDSDLLYDLPRLKTYLGTLNATPSNYRTFVLSEYGRDFTYGVTDWLTGPPTTGDYDPTQVDFFLTQVPNDPATLTGPDQTAMIPFTSHTLAPQVTIHLHGQQSVTEEWLIENATLEIHAFHIHQIHFRDVSVASGDPLRQPVLDTVTVPAAQLVGDVATGYPGAPGWVKLRMTFTKADVGEFVFHCHILEHEDNGMMAKIKVVAD